MNCQECENLMDEFVHQLLSSKTRKQFKQHLKSCSTCLVTYQGYKGMLKSLRSLDVQTCPDEVVENVYRILNLEKERKSRFSLIEPVTEFFNRYRWKIGLVGAAAAIMLCFILIYPRISDHHTTKQQYTEAEIEQAEDQVKLALSYFNEITSRTQKILEEQVLPQQVIKPMKSSIKTAIKPLINGGES